LNVYRMYDMSMTSRTEVKRMGEIENETRLF